MLRRASILVAVLAIVGFGALQPAPSRAVNPTYPLTCKPGPFLVSLHHAADPVSGAQQNFLSIRFTPGRGAATEGLQPGQCAWGDRAVRASEPTTLLLDPDDNYNVYFQNGKVTHLYVAIYPWLNGFVDGTGPIQIFQVHRDGTDFKVDRVGP